VRSTIEQTSDQIVLKVFEMTDGRGPIADLPAAQMDCRDLNFQGRAQALTSLTRILVEVAQGTEAKYVPPPPPTVLGRVVDDVATLAERAKVGRRAVTGIVIEVGAGEHDIGRPHCRERDALHGNTPTTMIPPITGGRVPPTAITQMRDVAHVRAGALLAAGIGTDRHQDAMSQADSEWKL
jgi:hypothetical protein